MGAVLSFGSVFLPFWLFISEIGIKYLWIRSYRRPNCCFPFLLKWCHLLYMVWWSLSLVMQLVREKSCSGGQGLSIWRKIWVSQTLGLSAWGHRWDSSATVLVGRMVSGKMSRESGALKDSSFLLYCGSISWSAGAVHCDSWGRLESSWGLPSRIILVFAYILVFAGWYS